MQSGDLITRCPHCNTTFRVTENQLEVAGGAVRCGSCLEIFTARNHIVELNTSLEQERGYGIRCTTVRRLSPYPVGDASRITVVQ